MNYGFGYMGSKSAIAKNIIDNLPGAENFYDLFAGGCAITHAAILSGKYKHVYCNDIDGDLPKLFLDAINGKFKDEKRWISREMYEELKDKETYISVCWSFGNKRGTYIYGRHIEPWKKALHYAVCFADYSLAEKFGFDFSPIDKVEGFYNRRIAMRTLVFEKYFKEGKLVKRGSRYYLPSGELGKKTELERLQGLQGLQGLQRLEDLQGLQRLQRKITISGSSYDLVNIKPNSIIYCDIPYENTSTYLSGAFDYPKFYSWVERQDVPVFVSSYDLPADLFNLYYATQKRSLVCATDKSQWKQEGLYVPVTQDCERGLFSRY